MVGAFRVHHRAHLLAFAAAGAHLHGGKQADEPVLIRQAALTDVFDQAVEGEGERTHGKFTLRELGGVEYVARIHPVLELPDGVHLVLPEEGDLGNADAVLTGNGPAHFLRLGHDPHGGFFRDFKHVQVIGVDGDIDVTVPVARVHVARHHNAADKHIVADFFDLGGKAVIALGHEPEEFHRAFFHFLVGKLGGRDAALRHAGHIDEFAVEILVLQRHAGQTPQLLQRLTVCGSRAFQIELFEEQREIRDTLHGNDHVLVDLESGRPAGDGGKTVAIFPEKFGFLLILRHEERHVVVRGHDIHDFLNALLQQVRLVAVHLNDDDGNGNPFVLVRLLLVLDGAHILGVELFQRRQTGVIAFLADAVAQIHDLANDHGGLMHGASVKFQYHDPRLRGFLVHDEGRIGDDAVHAFLLHTRKAAERLVGDVLAEARQTDFGTVQLHDAPHAAADVLDLKHGHFVRQNLMAGMVFALNADDLAGRRHHAPRKQVVQRRPVFEGERAAGVFRNVPADGRSGL